MPEPTLIIYKDMKKKKVASERVAWKKKSISMAKAIIRLLGKCQHCGKTKEEAQMHGSHIESVRHEATAALPENILCLCAYCHRRWWHESPTEAIYWFDKEWPGRRIKLRNLAQTTPKLTADQWKEVYEQLKVTYQKKLLDLS